MRSTKLKLKPWLKKMAQGRFTMDDFLKQIKSLRRMGSMKSVAWHAARALAAMMKNMDVDEGALDQVESQWRTP